MLVLTRKKSESIMIGDGIEIKIIAIEGDSVKIGIEAPRDIEVHRKEVYLAIQTENKMATESIIDLNQLKDLLNKQGHRSDGK